MIKKLFIILVIIACPLAVSAVPNTLTYQGKLLVDGTPANGTYNLHFAIFDSESNGTQLWPATGTEDHSIAIIDGLYNVILGSTSTLGTDVFNGDDAWLEVTVESTTLPRTKLHTVPYSFQAESISGVTKGIVTAGKPLVVDQNKDIEGFRNITIGAAGSEYTLPNSRGTTGQVMQTDGNGSVSWQTNDVPISPGNNVGDFLRWDGTSWKKVNMKHYYFDNDKDEFGDPTRIIFDFAPPNDNWVEDGTDCDDNNHNIRGVFYRDSDGDGWGDINVTIPNTECSLNPPAGYTLNYLDCDDNDPNLQMAKDYYFDSDGDGWGDDDTKTEYCVPPSGWVLIGEDCDDSNPDIHAEIMMWKDNDGDGYGDPATQELFCGIQSGWVDNNFDCDDTNPDVNIEKEYWIDRDGDGYGDPAAPSEFCVPPSEGFADNPYDCDDSDPNVNPGAVEIPLNGIDDDCDGEVDEL